MSSLKCLYFEFCLALAIMSHLLSISNVVSKNLQSSSLNIAAAALQVDTLVSVISGKRTDQHFEEFWAKATTMVKSIDVQFTAPRSPTVSKSIDKFWQTEFDLPGKDQLRVPLYIAAVDHFVSALVSRFGHGVMPLLRATDCLTKPSFTKAINTVGVYNNL